MNWQQIVDMTPEQFNSLSKQELKGYTQILASAGNKRLKRAQEADFDSPSIQAVLKRGKFSTKDKSLNQLRNEFMRAKSFLTSKTGTIQAFNKFKRDTIAELAKPEKGGIKITPEQFDVFWRSYEQLKEGKKDIAMKALKYTVLEEINDMMNDSDNISVEDIVAKLKPEVDKMYEEEQQTTKQAEDIATELDFWNAIDEVETPKTSRKESRTDENRQAAKAARTKARRKRK